MRTLTIVLSAVLVALFVSARAEPADVVSVWITRSNAGGVVDGLAAQPPVPLSKVKARADRRLVIRVDGTKTFQRMEGYGASLTDSSAWLLNRRLSASRREEVMRRLFDPADGIGLSFLRNPMGASDFARSWYTYDDNAGDKTDARLPAFSIDHDRDDILPLTKQARALNPALKLMMNPWSPPAWMKTPAGLVRGALSPDYYPHFTTYFVKALAAYREAGLPVDYVSLQNEPNCCDKLDYPSMDLSSEQQSVLLKDHFFPAFDREGIGAKILLLDFNWCNSPTVLPLLADPAIVKSPHVGGIAWHGYCGDVAIQSRLHDLSGLDVFFTEHSGFDYGAKQERLDFQDLVKVIRHWGRSYVKWNLVLDERRGPTIGGCQTCTGLVLVHDRDARAGEYDLTVEYYTIGHVSKFVPPGAYRIDSTDDAQILNVAFRNTDGSVVLVAYNDGDHPATFDVDAGGRGFTYTLDPGEAATFRWPGVPRATSPRVSATEAAPSPSRDSADPVR